MVQQRVSKAINNAMTNKKEGYRSRSIDKMFFRCGLSYLNGVYSTDPKDANSGHGIIWYNWLGFDYSLKTSTMKIIRK